MLRRALVLASAMSILTACARSSGAPATSPRFVDLGSLPQEGVAIELEGEHVVVLVDDGERPVSITGPPGLAHAVDAFALGWSVDGRAIVQLIEPACGRVFTHAGVYAFTDPGRGELVFRTNGPAFARMWGAA
jgi:hypothetical protein